MTRTPAPHRAGRLRALGALASAIGLAAGVIGVALGGAGAASASLGSVPPEVTAYVTSGAMVARLNDVYGPNASGTAGITFDDTTKAGPISRVYEWTADRLANRATDHPVQLTNNWVVPITIGGTSVGLARIWINPQTVDAELADFTPSAALGTALTTVPATAALVHDTATGAWLALDTGTITPLIAGKSGITGPVPVGSLKLAPPGPAPAATTEPNTGLALAIGVVGLIVLVILVALLLPRGRRARARAAAGPTAGEPTAGEPAAAESTLAEDATTTEPATPAPSPKATATATASRPAAAKASAPTAATPKPAGPRPAGRTPTTAAAAKPASSKPPASRPATSGPAASKPPAASTRRASRRPKPPSDSGSDASS